MSSLQHTGPHPPPEPGADPAPAPEPVAPDRAPPDLPWGRRLLSCLRLLRPVQWIKNVVVLLVPLLQLTAPSPREAGTALLAVALFILVSAGTYVINDVADRHRDRLHPVKRLRPVASGAVPVPLALALAVALFGALLALLVLHARHLAVPIGAYAVVNLLYCFALKHVPLLDVFIIAGGFVLRAWAGALAIAAYPSPWLYVSLFSACILLGFGKRRHELSVSVDHPDGQRGHRPALRGYSFSFIDSMLTFTAALCVLAYLSFLDSGTDPAGARVRVLLFTPLAVFAVARYLQILFVAGGSGDPSRTLLTDRWMLGIGLVWLVSMVGLSVVEAAG